MHVAHLTSVHFRYDTRIFHKMCTSLVDAGHEVTLVVADGFGGEACRGVTIVDVGESHGRCDRIINAAARVFEAALHLNCEIFHLHDPELLPVGLRLKRLGKRVIFDSHEDVPKQILGKPYLNHVALRVLSLAVAYYERYACARLDAVVAATPFIREKFSRVNPISVDINNFPIVGELTSRAKSSEARKNVCYVGGLGAIRGVKEMVRAMEHVRADVRLELGGRFTESDLSEEVRSYAGWKRVNELGYLDREEIGEMFARSIAGLVVLHPVKNYVDALPVKMFEYMSCGVPVISSNFPVWRDIVEGNQCGICIDPLRPAEIARAIDRVVSDPQWARQLGENGQRAILKKYNWRTEFDKLVKLYKSVIAL